MLIHEERFTCFRDGLPLRGMQYKPEGDNLPAIIFSHGFTGNYEGMISFCQAFAAKGYATFCFNFYGGGTLQDDGETTAMSLRSEVKDLAAVMAYVKALPFVDASRIILAGASQGGMVSGMTASAYPEDVHKLIMIFPALCIPDDARRGRLGFAHYDPANVPETIDCGRTVLGRHFHEEAAAMDPYLELAGYHGPVLLLQGTEDPIVNYAYAIRAKEHYAKGQCRLQMIRGMGHGMDDKQQESVIASMRQFLNDRDEVLTVHVVITDTEDSTEGNVRRINYHFTGYCDTPRFQGTILPGACDAQEHAPGRQPKIRADYTLDGLDGEGQRCTIHIVNQPGAEDWEPVIHTDSKALAWMNTAHLTAVLEGCPGGLTVRIYAQEEA